MIKMSKSGLKTAATKLVPSGIRLIMKEQGYTKEDLAQILCAVDKECLKALGITISELISKGTKNEFSK